MSYLRNAPSAARTPQSKPILGSGQVENSASGFVWAVGPLTRLRRWLVLGSEGGSYYASQENLTFENVAVLHEVAPLEALELVFHVSYHNRAPKNDQCIYALAHFAGHPDVDVRRRALDMLSSVCRTGTHLFQFVAYCDSIRPHQHWGTVMRRGIARWYARDIDQVAYQIIKYPQRFGYTHRDLLRLAHPAAAVSADNPKVALTAAHESLFAWVCGQLVKRKDLPWIAQGFLRARKRYHQGRLGEIPDIIWGYGLPREAIESIDSRLLNDEKVWKALFDAPMPLTALIRNLPKMTNVGLLRPLGTATQHVTGRVTDSGSLMGARVHPVQLLIAALTYQAGRSLRGSATWTAVPEIANALNEGFYKAFGSVERTGRRHLLAVDVSGSMTQGQVAGVPGLTPRLGAAAMALVQANVGDPHHIVAFSADIPEDLPYWQRAVHATELFYPDKPHTWAIKPLDIAPGMRLKDVQHAMIRTQAGGTDIALPMLYAIDNQLEIDVFVIYTDNESWAGDIHPSQALAKYRAASGINARLVVVSMLTNGYSVADPNDSGQMDVVGFDAASPQLISDFAKGVI